MILIIQTGDPVEKAKPLGSFADYFIQGMLVQPEQAQVINVHRSETLPNCSNKLIKGVIITGSAAMITEQTTWMRQTQHWLELAMQQHIPILGVCFGHQMLADMLGGKVDYNPKGRHMGNSWCELNASGKNDSLLGNLTENDAFCTLVSHQQCVVKAPDTVQVLATCEMDQNHVFRYQNQVWGVQFHPEWNPQIMQAYISQRANDLSSEGYNPKTMIAGLQSCHAAQQLLINFKNLIL